ncbi:phosphatase PAP2 family protein [Paenibacillus gansuensis]|uniref:Phosphatase PAP2 family protein n=1 Tax=Paenibacillus gansuensis TaxID=306542 RepID=A0ABW5PCY9_9BACL
MKEYTRNEPWKKWIPFAGIAFIPLLSMIYAWLNNAEAPVVHSLYTDLDEAIPFVKAFIIPYALWIPYLYVTFLLLAWKNKSVYYRALAAYTVSALVCYLIYYFFQTTVIRPELAGDDIFTNLLAFVYRNDEPVNCFPSIHCMSSFLLIVAVRKTQAAVWAKRGVAFFSWTIILSTLLVKQHVILDAAAGIVLAKSAYLAADYVLSRLQWGRVAYNETNTAYINDK